MITNAKNLRAIEAIKRNDSSYFSDSLSDYLLEVLESLEIAPTDSEYVLLYKEVNWVINLVVKEEQQEAINEIFEDFIQQPKIDTVGFKTCKPIDSSSKEKWNMTTEESSTLKISCCIIIFCISLLVYIG